MYGLGFRIDGLESAIFKFYHHMQNFIIQSSVVASHQFFCEARNGPKVTQNPNWDY